MDSDASVFPANRRHFSLTRLLLNAALEGRNQISSPLAGEDKGEGDKIGGRQDTLTPLLAGQAPTFTPPRRGSPVKGEGDGC